MQTQQEYERREADLFRADLARPQQNTRHERRQDADRFQETLINDPEIIAERVRWLLLGTYGYGSVRAAWQVVDTCKNPGRELLYYVAAIEWSTTSAHVARIWRELTDEQRATVARLIAHEVETFPKEERPIQ